MALTLSEAVRQGLKIPDPQQVEVEPLVWVTGIRMRQHTDIELEWFNHEESYYCVEGGGCGDFEGGTVWEWIKHMRKWHGYSDAAIASWLEENGL